MKRIVTTAAIIVALTLPAFAEGDDASAKAGDAKNSSIKSDTNKNAEQPGGTTMGRRATTGSSAVAPQQQEQLKSTSGADNAGSKGGDSGSSAGGSGNGK